ncbi:fimbria/pilus chaperone family protein [Enterobacteriaceae bacterium H11S18]|uniref:fimbria/pilus chaperone family protein n=1 Tax=Dryocola clanedunensis TaxID=2925396 RepID=UPI0022F0114F|nr:fimbria/pilus chaperone family protein [Dryocola clanedunensis]MCT4712099.1 fimbria/pilus chaperone family protein [Dryocola clanedunensis]
MKLSSFIKTGAAALLLTSTFTHATGMVPETSVVMVEQQDGEGSISIKNTDSYPVLLITALQSIPEDKAPQLAITPPAARVEPGKSQVVRFMLAEKTPLTTEHLMRVTFEGVPPQQKNQNVVRMSVRQNLPVLIRPTGLAKDAAPWKRLTWKQSGDSLTVSNTSPYVVRLGQGVQTLPDNTNWLLATPYVLPGQTLTLKMDGAKKAGTAAKVRISPATNWGYTVDNYDAELVK